MLTLIKKARVFDTGSAHHGQVRDILIKKGNIERVAARIQADQAHVIDVPGLCVSAGWFDLFAHFGEPGAEQKETLQTGQQAAAAGGFTEVCLLPNTTPPVSSRAMVEFIIKNKNLVTLHPIGSVSRQFNGQDLAEMLDMKQAGAVAFSDGFRSIQSSALLMKALQYVKAFNGVIIQIPDEFSISRYGFMHEGIMSTSLGLPGKPDITESLALQRDIDLLRYTRSRLHITGISSKTGVELIRKAKKEGLQITCSVSPYHLLFTDQALSGYDTVFKVNPPLRSETDRQALLKGVLDGTIDAIASHHQPQDQDSKQVEFDQALEGMISLQTVWPMLLKSSQKISSERWAYMLAEAPRKILDLPCPHIREGETANMTLFSREISSQYNEQNNLSLSVNSPMLGQQLPGKVIGIIHQGQTRIHE